jgi:large subunit ribosomal protein L21
MYAVIETGGKQYRVEVGTELEVELLHVEPGKTITLDRVLLVADGADTSIGRPLVDGAAVSAEVLRRDRGDKVIAFKYRPKARRRVKKGHRQELTVLRISDIVLDGKSAAKVAAKAESDAKTERQRLEEGAAAQAAKDAELAAKLAAKTPAKASATTDDEPAKAAPTKGAAKAETKPAKADTRQAKADTTKGVATSNAKPAAGRSAAKAADAKPAKADAKPAKADAKPAKASAARKPRVTKKDE